MPLERVTVIGAGAWGTALAQAAASAGRTVTLVARDPAVVETIRVEPGFEAALGAALGDDLEAPMDAAAPMHWSGAGPVPGDPALPEGSSPLSGFVEAPAAIARGR